jgi:prominin 1
MDKCSSVHCIARWLTVALLLSPLASQGDILEEVCPAGRAALITNATQGVNPSYDGGAIDPWVSLSRDFVNAVKKENLPYDVIEEAVEEGGFACDVGTRQKDMCVNHTSSSFPVGQTFAGFLDWWTPILAVACVGVAVGVAFLVAGCVVCGCRCCGNCGGGYSMKQSHDCTMFSCTLLLLLFTLALLAGVVLTLYSNQQTFDSLDSVQDSVNRATDYGVEYAERLINDGIALFCLVVDKVRLSLEQLDDLGSSLGVLLSDIATRVETFLQLLEANVDAIEASGGVLDRIVSSSTQLDSRQQALHTALEDVADLANSVLVECERTPGADCEGLPHGSIFVSTTNYSLVEDMTGVSSMVNQTLDEVDFRQEVSQGRSNFSENMQMIERNITMHMNQSEMELERLNETVIEQRDNITNSTREVIRRDVDECSDYSSLLGGAEGGAVDLNAGYIQHCIVDQGFEKIHEYDLYRYSFGVGVACLSLVVVILVLVGMVLGVVGWRPKKQPFDRTRVSHCGGRFLLVAVGVAFVFGCLVMIMAAFGFFFGSNAQKVCQSLEGPDYEGFENTLDNEELWGGSLLGKVVFDDPRKTLSFSQLLRNCEADYALYRAMNLTFLFNIRTDITNFTEVTENLSEEILGAAQSVQLSSDSFFSSEGLQGLRELNRLLSNINIQPLQDELSRSVPTLGFSPDDVVHNLTVYRDTTVNGTTRDQVDMLVSQIEGVSDVAREIDTIAASLLDDVNILHRAVTTTSTLVDQSADLIDYITGDGLALVLNNNSTKTFIAIAGYIDDFIEDLANGVRHT